MMDSNYELQVKASEIIVKQVANDLANMRSELLYELFGIHTVQEFNEIPHNTVKIINGKIEYNKEVINELFGGLYSGTIDECQKSILGKINVMFHFIKNVQIIKCCMKLNKENNRIYNLYFSPENPENIYNELTKAQETILLSLNNTPKDQLEYYGGLDNFIKKCASSTSLPAIKKKYLKDFEKTKKLVKKLNSLTI